MKSSEIIKSNRGKLLLTQDDVANRLKVSRATYNSWENNPLQCPIDIIFKIINELNGNVDDFLNAIKQDYLSLKDIESTKN